MINNNSGTTPGEDVVNQSGSSDERPGSDSHNNTRRQFIVGSAGALGGLAVGSALPGSALAQEDDGTEDDGDSDDDNGGFEDDVAILNYALTLEYLEARFYKQGLDNIGEEALCTCKVLGEDSDLRDRVYDELRTIQEHEEQHVDTLVSTIESLGGTPIEEPEFDFGLAVQYPMAFLGTAAQLEDIGVSAYAGAAPYIENEDLVAPALGIHSVEARHASFLRTLTSQTGFPNVIDEPRSQSEVLELAGSFIVDGEDDESPDDNSTDNGMDDSTGNSTDNRMDDSTGNSTDNGMDNSTGNSTDNRTDNSTGNSTETSSS